MYEINQVGTETVEFLPDANDDQYYERLAHRCVEMLFAQTQLPCSVVEQVQQINEHHGLWTAIAAADVVLRAFEAGTVWGKHDAHTR